MAIPEWSTDVNFPAGSNPWSSQPTKVEPAAAMRARGFVPGSTPPAGWFNWLFNQIITAVNGLLARIVSDEWVYPAAKTRTVCIGFNGASGATWTPVSSDRITSSTSGAYAYLDISDCLPSGATLTSVVAYVYNGAARATQSDRMVLNVVRLIGYSSSSTLGTGYDDGGAPDFGTITVSGLSSVIDRSQYRYVLELRKGNDATAEFGYKVDITFTDPGPRNY